MIRLNHKYSNVACPQGEQGINGATWWSTAYPACNFPGGNSTAPHADVLENFNPNLSDPFKWIPKGLMWDLIDTGEPAYTHVNDLISGVTTSQIFSALQNGVTTIAQYKARLLQQIVATPTQTTNINNLFSSYGY